MKIEDIRIKQTIYLKRNFWGEEKVYATQDTIEVKYTNKSQWQRLQVVKEYDHMNLKG